MMKSPIFGSTGVSPVYDAGCAPRTFLLNQFLEAIAKPQSAQKGHSERSE
jgi:hypothetical protein